MHGANLGVRASTYLAAGGFPPEPAHEDRLLVDRVNALPDAVAIATIGAPVHTSDRLEGRVRRGVSSDLRLLQQPGAARQPVTPGQQAPPQLEVQGESAGKQCAGRGDLPARRVRHRRGDLARLASAAAPAPLDWEGLDHVVVVAAHPDDETLGAAGLMAEASGRGVAVDVVVATLGEASHPRSSTITPERLSRWRAREVTGAVGLLAPRAVLHLLHLPDGELQRHVPAVTARVAGLAGAGSLVVAPWVGDGHPDHTAAGLGAARAADDVRARSLEYPVWAWHWSAPADPRVPWQQMVRHPLTPAARRLKRRALALHRSQTQPLSDQPGDETLLRAGFLDHFDRPHEVFVGPRHDAAGPDAPA